MLKPFQKIMRLMVGNAERLRIFRKIEIEEIIMKKFWGIALLGLALGANSVLFAQDGQNPPPTDGKDRKFSKRGGQDGPGGRGGMRGMRRGGGSNERQRGPRGGMRGGGFRISDDELFKLNLTNDQKVKLFDFRKKMFDTRGAEMKNRRPAEGGQPAERLNPQEMRQLMSAKSLGTLTAEQKAKLDGIEAKRKEMMDKRKTEMDQRKAKMDQTHQEFLNIFTLDQRKQLEQMRAEKGKQMQERMQQRQQRRGPGGQKPATAPAKPNN